MIHDSGFRPEGIVSVNRSRWTPLAVLSICALVAAPAQARTVDTSSRSDVVSFYEKVYLASNGVPAKWTGSTSSCHPGKVSGDYRDAGMLRVNYYRAMAGLPGDVELSSEWNAKCQAAALIMTANRRLSHFPKSSWRCYTAAGAEAAAKSNLALGYESLPDAVDGWMRDVTTPSVGHRRWILYPPQEVMGIGATFGENNNSAYALWVNRKQGLQPRAAEWVAWPPRGFVPYQIVPDFWSFSYPHASFGGAKVTMRHDGRRIPVTLERVDDGYGDNTLVWKPKGLSTDAPLEDETYSVTISGVSIGGTTRSFTYDVTVIDPR
jgi:hypothetical protein